MNERSDKLLRILQLAGDVLLLNLCFLISGWLRFDDLKVENEQYYNYYIQLLIFFNLSWILIGVGFGVYNLRPGTEIRTSLARTINGLLSHAVLFAVLAVSLKGSYYSRLFLIYFYSFFGVGLLVFRSLFISLWRRWLARGRYARKVWLVGGGAAHVAFGEELELHPEYGYRLTGSPSEVDQASDFIRQQGKPDEIYAAFEKGDPEMEAWFVFAEKEGIRFRYLPDLKWTNIRHARVELVGDVPVLIPRKEPLSYWHSRLLKRFFDILISLVVLITILWWLIPILALIIRLDSPGNPIFIQRRSGINGADFPCYKLRTMVKTHGRDADQVTDRDPRVTRVGTFLRKHNLDELPQFLNVLQGQMSVVGPRPHMLEHTENYRRRIDEFMVRHWIKPGITGLAQVMGLRGETREDSDMADRVRVDVYYLEHWSILLDVKVFFWTVWNMFTGKRTGI